MQSIPLERVVVPENRQRREFDQKKMVELKESIKKNGLYQPIVVEESGDSFILRAGERRLRVIRDLTSEGRSIVHGAETIPAGHIPAVRFGSLDALRQLEIEVEENCVRVDFTWQERTRAFAALHALRIAQNPAQTLTATASEIIGKQAEGSQVSAVSEAVVLAKHLDNPEVAKAATPKEALKVVRRIAESTHRAKLAETFDTAKTEHSFLKGDAIELLTTTGEGLFDVILTDPPYGVNADKFGTQSDTGHDYEDSEKYFESFANILAEESYRVAKPRAHAYVFCDSRRFERLALLFQLSGWSVFPSAIIWDKGNNGMLPLPEHGPRRTYESILYAWKGDRPVLSVKRDLIRVMPVKRLLHGAQKPVALYRELLSRSANPGDAVLDPFAGTGTIFVAANMMKLTATGFERTEATYNIGLGRMSTMEIDDGADIDDGIAIEV
jgi:DNA modification methylase